MAIPILKLKLEAENVYSPLSGKPAFTKDGSNRRDPNLLFVFIGDAGQWDYVSKEVRSQLQKSGKDVEKLSPAALCRRLDLPGAVCLEVDGGWNGVNWVAWAKPEA